MTSTKQDDFKNHNKLVADFMKQKREEDPEKVKEVEEKYPTLSWRRRVRNGDIEITVGLLGLEPAHISVEVAEENGLESIFMRTHEDG